MAFAARVQFDDERPFQARCNGLTPWRIQGIPGSLLLPPAPAPPLPLRPAASPAIIPLPFPVLAMVDPHHRPAAISQHRQVLSSMSRLHCRATVCNSRVVLATLNDIVFSSSTFRAIIRFYPADGPPIFSGVKTRLDLHWAWSERRRATIAAGRAKWADSYEAGLFTASHAAASPPYTAALHALHAPLNRDRASPSLCTPFIAQTPPIVYAGRPTAVGISGITAVEGERVRYCCRCQ
ncbi:hypothetical protein C8J57DRAFT_1499658 [Mycena rebaudengoi]|nr:hypothetical protein C8J57DRAFT_1499658 [Mycena rebaudengoi]